MLEFLDLVANGGHFFMGACPGETRINIGGLAQVVGGLLKKRQKLVVLRQKESQYGTQGHGYLSLQCVRGFISSGIITRHGRPATEDCSIAGDSRASISSKDI